MKFTVALPELQKTLQTALQAVPPKSTLPVLENFHFVLEDASLLITATDQELTIISRLVVDGQQNGEMLVPARRLTDIVKALGSAGRVTMSMDKKSYKITLKTDFGEYVLHGLDAAEFPAVPDFASGTSIELSGKDAMRIAKTASFAASRDEYRPAMTGMLMECDTESLTAVTTDGYRLVKMRITPQEGKQIADKKTDVIIPIRAIDLLKRVEGDVIILLSPTHAKFSSAGATIITRIIDERFPPYQSVIPADNDKTVRVSPLELIAAVKRVALFANSNTKQVRFRVSPNTITVLAEDQETGNNAHENVTCDYAGEEFEIGFNHRYVEEAITHLTDEGVNAAAMTFSNPNRAALLKPLRDDVEADDVLMLVMPVRL
ncbi:MAG: DNA polymerase III subunit beta [Candidatus Kapaibacterium sp.]|nr:MAG: DNA polymerase III subunit beta [Candidatus Kapabacteria bacterium]